MCQYWETEEAQERKTNASIAKNSQPHIHLTGQKSYLQIQQEMEEELGRPMSIGEVFIRVHTKAYGMFVDDKARQICETYEKSLQDRLEQILVDPSEVSDGATHRPELTEDEKNAIFIQSTLTYERGRPLDSVVFNAFTAKEQNVENSLAFMSLQQQLEAARHDQNGTVTVFRTVTVPFSNRNQTVTVLDG